MPKDRNLVDPATGILPAEDEYYAQEDKKTNATEVTAVTVPVTQTTYIKVKGTGQIGDYPHTTSLNANYYTGGVALDLTGAVGYGSGTYFGNYQGFNVSGYIDYGNTIAYSPTDNFALPVTKTINTTSLSTNQASDYKIFGGTLFIDKLKYFIKSTQTWNDTLDVELPDWTGGSNTTSRAFPITIQGGYIWGLTPLQGMAYTARPNNPSLLYSAEATPTTFVKTTYPVLSGTYYDTPFDPHGFDAFSSGMCSGGGYIWAYGYEWKATSTSYLGNKGWWYIPATPGSSWTKHSNFASTSRGVLEIPAVDLNGDLWTILTNGDVVKYGRSSGTTTYSAASVWTTISPLLTSTYSKGVSVSTAFCEDSGNILICGAVEASYVYSLTGSAIPCIWRLNTATQVATPVWIGPRFMGSKTTTGAMHLKKHPSGTGYIWTVAGGTSNDTYICTGVL